MPSSPNPPCRWCGAELMRRYGRAAKFCNKACADRAQTGPSLRGMAACRPGPNEFGPSVYVSVSGCCDAEALIDASDLDWFLDFPGGWRTKAHSSTKVYVGCADHTKGMLHQHLLDVPPGMMRDHRNGDSLDNRRANLRCATPSQNSYNKGPKAGHSIKGVWPHENGKFRAVFTPPDRRRRSLGYFDTKETAAEAWLAEERRHRGEFCWPNRRPDPALVDRARRLFGSGDLTPTGELAHAP